VTVPLQDVLLVVLATYVAYSAWTRANPRLPLYGALLVLLGAAVASATGASALADSLAIDVVFLLVAGVVLLAIARVRPSRPRSAARRGAATDPPRPDPAQKGEATSQHPLDHLEGEVVPVVDAAGQDHDQNEQGGDPEPDDG
jgi:hypothetical protein